jgi:MoaA/NifB/PqqE/SkfB family radical SAM enzyme
MECKFLDHGLAIAYQETVKPCCIWQFDENYKSRHQLEHVNLVTWHHNKDIQNAKDLLSKDIWPKNCSFCKEQENQGRTDSMRLNAASSYAAYGTDDITLEIRPGSVCNFACQTCWPAASSRVNEYYRQAGIKLEKKEYTTSVDIDKKFDFNNFNFLQPIANRIKSVVLLGGEPFYDKNCLAFLDWWDKNTSADLLVFTNGSNIKFDILQNSNKKITLVFSLDAVGKPAEYIRFGTDWVKVFDNFSKSLDLDNVDVRVNITQSVYNYIYLDKLIELFIDNWPNLVTFGIVFEQHFNESVIPIQHRQEIIDRLETLNQKLSIANIEQNQKYNTINAIATTINNLQHVEFNKNNWEKFKHFVTKMDQVKGIDIRQYCPEVANYIYQSNFP